MSEKTRDGKISELNQNQAAFYTDGISFVMASDLVDGSSDFKTCNYISKTIADRLQKGFALAGDVLISHKATIGVTAIVPPSVEHYVMLTPQVTYYRVLDSQRLSNVYLRAYFEGPQFQRPLHMVANDGSTRAYIVITKQRDLPVIVPLLDEQKQIAEAANSLERKMTVEKHRKEALILLFRTLLHQLMTAQIRVHNLDLSVLDEPVAGAVGAA